MAKERVIRVDTIYPASIGTTKVPIYKYANTTYDLGYLARGINIQVYEESGGWVRFRYNGDSAYVRATDVRRGKRINQNPMLRSRSNSLRSRNDADDLKDSDFDKLPTQVRTGEGHFFAGDTTRENAMSPKQLEGYKEEQWKFIRALGVPPKFTMDIDIQYDDAMTPGIGRVYSKTLMSNPSILSICPGKANFLPGLSGSDKESFMQRVKGMAEAAGNPELAGALEKDLASTGGKLYEFAPWINGFAKRMNAIIRAFSIMLGCGDQKIPGTSTKAKDFDYAFWCMREKFVQGAPNNNSVWRSLLDSAAQTVYSTINSGGKNTYMHFFLTNSETSVSEDIGTSTESSMIEDLFSNSGMDKLAKNINYLFGTGMGQEATKGAALDMENLMNSEDGHVLKSLVQSASNYIQGGRMAFPQMLGDVNYGKGLDCSLTFISPYGDPFAVFLNCYVPVAHLLALALPEQISENMYTYPFILRVYQKGWFVSDLAIMSNLKIERGGQDTTSWTVEGLPTEWNCNFTITPLYSSLMLPSSDHPLLAMRNDALLEYLSNLCNYNTNTNIISLKMELLGNMITNRVRDFPRSLGRAITDRLAATVEGLFGWQE